MTTVQTSNLSVGMILAKDVYSKAGQLIVRKDFPLTRQMIAHLKYYSIQEVDIQEGDLPEDVLHAVELRTQMQNTQLEKLLKSEDYRIFKKDYASEVTLLQNSINDIILRNAPIDAPQLIDQTVKIFNSSNSYFSLFGMLHSMKQIDDSTYAHSINVGMIARLIGTWCGFTDSDLDNLTLAGLLHDIGKCQIPDEILMKPGRLTDEEYEIIKKHPKLGYEYIKDQDLDPRIKQAVLSHHERCDGTGYPSQKTLNELDDFSCIISIADVYDAMTADRCYRSGLCPFEVISSFENNGLQKYHPRYITTFLQKIADSYLNSDVMLSNNMVARVVYINTRLTRPIVQLHDKTFVNLLNYPDIYIQSII